jgi:hypothetical protein
VDDHHGGRVLGVAAVHGDSQPLRPACSAPRNAGPAPAPNDGRERQALPRGIARQAFPILAARAGADGYMVSVSPHSG